MGNIIPGSEPRACPLAVEPGARLRVTVLPHLHLHARGKWQICHLGYVQFYKYIARRPPARKATRTPPTTMGKERLGNADGWLLASGIGAIGYAGHILCVRWVAGLQSIARTGNVD